MTTPRGYVPRHRRAPSMYSPRHWVGPRNHPLRDVGVAVAGALVILALVRSLIFQPFEIPSGSMEDTLAVGDRVAVTVYDSDEIARGDVVVFVDPDDWLTVSEPTGITALSRKVLSALYLLPDHAGHHLIKRVIGVGGDHIVADGHGSLTVNGVPLSEPYLRPGSHPSSLAFDVTVPDGYIWVMGDNRDRSADSRFHMNDAHGGFVPLTDVVGVAKAVVWPVDHWKMLDDGEAAFADIPAPSGGSEDR